MNFWWVNHKQTFRQEFFGKYIWSPKRKRNDQINPFYETMREVAPDDIVYSFADGAIQGFGMARTHCYTSPRPDEFGHIGQAWNEVGWRVDIDFQKFTEPILPTQHMQAIAPTMPERYSPIRQNGYGNQGVYLAQIPRPMALVIAQLASPELWELFKASKFPKQRKHRCRNCAASWNGKSANVNRFLKTAVCAKRKNKHSSKPDADKDCFVNESHTSNGFVVLHVLTVLNI